MLFAAVIGFGCGTANADDPPFRETIQVRVAPNDLRALKVELFDTATGKTLAKAATLTDMWLRLWHDTGNINEIIDQPNLPSPRPDEAAMTIELFTVVDGRIHSDTTGTCAAFSGDVAWCKYGCDGQGFLLQRVSSQDRSYDLRILVAAKSPKRSADGSISTRGPLPLTLCGADERGYELLVVPASGKGEAEIKLQNK